MSLICRLIWICVEIYDNREYTCDFTDICTDAIFTYLNIMFLGVGAFLNLNNWIAFTIAIRNYDLLRANRKRLVPATFVIYLCGFLVTCADKNGEIQNDAYDFITWVSFILFAFNGISFILVGINLRIQLRKWNEDIERRNRAKISFSMLILSIPFLIRAGYILVRLNIDMESKINKSIEDDDYFAPIFSFVYICIADLIPITAQLSSMLVVINREDRGRENETTEDHIRDTENEYYGSFVNKGSKNRKINGSADSKTLRLINGSREFSADAIQFKSSLSNKVLESDRENNDSDKSDDE